jgi:hypothetical protein
MVLAENGLYLLMISEEIDLSCAVLRRLAPACAVIPLSDTLKY